MASKHVLDYEEIPSGVLPKNAGLFVRDNGTTGVYYESTDIESGDDDETIKESFVSSTAASNGKLEYNDRLEESFKCYSSGRDTDMDMTGEYFNCNICGENILNDECQGNPKHPLSFDLERAKMMEKDVSESEEGDDAASDLGEGEDGNAHEMLMLNSGMEMGGRGTTYLLC